MDRICLTTVGGIIFILRSLLIAPSIISVVKGQGIFLAYLMFHSHWIQSLSDCKSWNSKTTGFLYQLFFIIIIFSLSTWKVWDSPAPYDKMWPLCWTQQECFFFFLNQHFNFPWLLEKSETTLVYTIYWNKIWALCWTQQEDLLHVVACSHFWCPCLFVIQGNFFLEHGRVWCCTNIFTCLQFLFFWNN